MRLGGIYLFQLNTFLKTEKPSQRVETTNFKTLAPTQTVCTGLHWLTRALSVHYYKWIDIDCQDAPDTCEYSAFSFGKTEPWKTEHQPTRTKPNWWFSKYIQKDYPCVQPMQMYAASSLNNWGRLLCDDSAQVNHTQWRPPARGSITMC